MNQSSQTSPIHTFEATSSVKVAVVSSSWHKPIVGNAIKAIKEYFDEQYIPDSELDFFEVPGAFELPLHAKKLAQTGNYEAIIACGLVVNGGIYKHEFVASAVIDGLMQVQLVSGTPVFSAVLTPHHFHGHSEHINFFANHFKLKGEEVAQACIETVASLRNMTGKCA